MVEIIDEKSTENSNYKSFEEKELNIKQITGRGAEGSFQVFSICEVSQEVFDTVLEQKPPEESRY